MAQNVESREHNQLRDRHGALLRAASALREARRAGNRERREPVGERRCECARPACRATFPAVAEAHRGRPERFIVVADHLAGETVVAAADRFFVVELPREASVVITVDRSTRPSRFATNAR